MIRIISTATLSLLLISNIASAQSIADRLARKVERAAEAAAEKKIGEALERKASEIFYKVYSSGDDSTSIRVEDDRVIMTDEQGQEIELTTEAPEDAPAEVQPASFIGSFQIEVKEYNGDRLKKDYPVTISYFFEAYQFAFQVPAENNTETIMIVDRRTRKITNKVTDDDGNKTAMIMPMLRVKATVQDNGTQGTDFTIRPTGNTRTIEGFLCKEYAFENEDQTGTMWITEEWAFDYGVFADFAQMKNASTGQITDWGTAAGVSGVVLESRMQDKKGDGVHEFFLRNIRQGSNDAVFSTTGYEVSDMSSMFGR